MHAQIAQREDMLHDLIRALRTVQLSLNRVEQNIERTVFCTQKRERMSLRQRIQIIRINGCSLRMNLIVRERARRRIHRPVKEC